MIALRLRERERERASACSSETSGLLECELGGDLTCFSLLPVQTEALREVKDAMLLFLVRFPLFVLFLLLSHGGGGGGVREETAADTEALP